MAPTSVIAQPHAPPTDEETLRVALVVFASALAGTLLLAVAARDDFTGSSKPVEDRPALGAFAAVLAALIFGSYGVLIKSPRLQQLDLDTMVFQCYCSLGIALSSAAVLAVVPLRISPWGVLGAGQLVVLQVFAVNAIRSLGLAVAPSVWAGLSIVVSFLWGRWGFGEPLAEPLAAIFGLVLLIAGIAGLALANFPAVMQELRLAVTAAPSTSTTEESDVELNPLARTAADEEDTAPLPRPSRTTLSVPPSKLIGLGFCAAVGLLNGSLMVPFHFLSQEMAEDASCLAYLGSFAVGIVLTTPVSALFYFFFPLRLPLPPWHVREALVPGVITGSLWAFGNFAATLATAHLGNTLGYPLTQTGIIVSGCWGIFFFRERVSRSLFAASAVVIVAGGLLLALSKQ